MTLETDNFAKFLAEQETQCLIFCKEFDPQTYHCTVYTFRRSTASIMRRFNLIEIGKAIYTILGLVNIADQQFFAVKIPVVNYVSAISVF